MMIVGCDFHPSFQQVAILDTESGELQAHKLMHATGGGTVLSQACCSIADWQGVGRQQPVVRAAD